MFCWQISEICWKVNKIKNLFSQIRKIEELDRQHKIMAVKE